MPARRSGALLARCAEQLGVALTHCAAEAIPPIVRCPDAVAIGVFGDAGTALLCCAPLVDRLCSRPVYQQSFGIGD